MLGIDLIEFKKAKGIYHTHKNRLDSFFCPREIAYIQKGRGPHERFAVLLAAKEAAFKALPHLGTGLSVFRDIEIVTGPASRLSAKLNGTDERPNLKFEVLRSQKYVVVQCAGI